MKVYFILGGRHIKIGKSEKPEQRLRELQTGHPSELMLLGTVNGDRENEIHRFFESFRSTGEWFRVNQDLARWIETEVSLRSGACRKLRQAMKKERKPSPKEPVPLIDSECDWVMKPDSSLMQLYELNPFKDCTGGCREFDPDCDFCVWDDAARRIEDDFDIITRIGLNQDRSQIVLELKPISSQRRQAQLDGLGRIAFDLDEVEWSMTAVLAADPYRGFPGATVDLWDLHFGLLETYRGAEPRRAGYAGAPLAREKPCSAEMPTAPPR